MFLGKYIFFNKINFQIFNIFLLFFFILLIYINFQFLYFNNVRLFLFKSFYPLYTYDFFVKSPRCIFSCLNSFNYIIRENIFLRELHFIEFYKYQKFSFLKLENTRLYEISDIFSFSKKQTLFANVYRNL